MSFQKASSKNYFQQKVNYTIQVSLNDSCHELNAFEQVEYINNSPDTLNFLLVHLWPNGYSGNNTDLAKQLVEMNGKSKLFNDHDLIGFIDSLDFIVNNRQIQWSLQPGHPDICKLMLHEPLLPRDTLHIATPFHVKLPKGVTSRLGHVGESYQISQWYPKLAVYDKDGWHPMSYLDQGEYYADFGRFDVSITLPDNYIVGATGNLQNEKEIARLDSLASDTSWMSHLDKAGYRFPTSAVEKKTLRYTEENIHDFAWFADKRFHVLKGSVQLPESGKTVTTWVLFTNKQASLWKNAIHYVNNALSNFSEWVGSYPYSSFTAVQSTLNAGIGMEYPGIAVIGWVQDGFVLDKVIAHELGHSWFYSALASNERRYPFMDESITTSYEMRYFQKWYPEKKLWEHYFENPKVGNFFSRKIPASRSYELQWLDIARDNREQPLNLASTEYDYSNYSTIIYDKGGIGFTYLRAYLGNALFDAAVQSYFRVWKFRHPQPNNLQEIFEKITGKNLDWFFVDFISTTKRLDYKLVRLKGQKLLVRNEGELNAPLVLVGMKRDSIYFEQWEEGFEGEKWIDIPDGNYSHVQVDPLHQMPELYRLNNNIRRLGLSPKADPMHFQLPFSFEDPDKRNLVMMPAVNWSREDGFMLGAILHCGFTFPKPLDFVLMPFYSFQNNRFAGYGKVSYNITPFETIVQKMTLSLEGSQFGAPGNQNYHQSISGLELFFRPSDAKNSFRHKVFAFYTSASDLAQILLSQKAKIVDYLQFGYEFSKSSIVNPYRIQSTLEGNSTYQKATAEINYRYSYNGRNNGLDMRLFGGGMLNTHAQSPFYSLAPSGRSGRELYQFQVEYPDRFGSYLSSFWSRQMSITEGGLVSPVNMLLGYSKWLVSLSIASDIPGRIGSIGIKPFINVLLNDHGLSAEMNSPFFFEAGLKTGIGELFEISVPLIVSKNIQTITGSTKDRIRFTFNLGNIGKLKTNLAVFGI